MNALVISSVLLGLVHSRPDGPHHTGHPHPHQVHSGVISHHGVQVHHSSQIHHSAPVHHNSMIHHSAPVSQPAPQTIAELVVGNPNFSTLLAAVKAADLVDTLS